MINKRNAPRRRALKTAAIVISEKAPKIPCAVRNLSETGVALQVSTTIGIPQTFDVVIEGRRQRCRAMWRTDTEIGVVFEGQKRMPAPHHKGRSSPNAKEHRFPYHVDMLVPVGGFGAGLNTIHAWLEARGVPAVTGRGRHTDSGDYIRWCFADPDVAVEFANIFDGLIGRRRRQFVSPNQFTAGGGFMFAVGLAPSPPMLRPAAHSCHCRRDGNLTLCGSGLRGSRIGPAGTQPTALRSISEDLDPDQSE